MTFQHMAFDDYVVGASSKRRREWAKIQGRFEEIVFSNTLGADATHGGQDIEE